MEPIIALSWLVAITNTSSFIHSMVIVIIYSKLYERTIINIIRYFNTLVKCSRDNIGPKAESGK
jgi:hypothetical protein